MNFESTGWLSCNVIHSSSFNWNSFLPMKDNFEDIFRVKGPKFRFFRSATFQRLISDIKEYQIKMPIVQEDAETITTLFQLGKRHTRLHSWSENDKNPFFLHIEQGGQNLE